MEFPLTVPSLLQHAAANHGDTEIVSRDAAGAVHRTSWSEVAGRARRLAAALAALGVTAHERVGTLAWNGFRHLEVYYAASGMGAVTHTINPRLHEDQLAWIIGHAGDVVLFVEPDLLPLAERVLSRCGEVRHVVVLCERSTMPATPLANAVCYEELLDAARAEWEWPALDERSACGLCYTSGTTGDPKGVLYDHRSTVLHALSILTPDVCNLSSRDVVAPVVPMFHVNAWGLPYAAAIAGFKLVLPGPRLDGASLHGLFEDEGVTFTAGIATVWLGLLEHWRRDGVRPAALQRIVVGGAPCPPPLLQALENDFGVTCQHAWGMTELSPFGATATLKARHQRLDAKERMRLRLKQGRAPYGIEMRLRDDEDREVPHDGATSGHLQVRGAWVASGYFGATGDDCALTPDGWFPTGDIATIDADGFMQITDRAKDVVKSGGEWISSIDIQNAAMLHPGVHEAAVVGVPHPKWQERPLLIVVPRAGSSLTPDSLLQFLDGRIARWWVPDDVVILPELPHTSVGKLDKRALRERFHDHLQS